MCARSPVGRHQRGLSIIEIMVGMVIALLVSLAATGGAAVFTASQRQGIGAGGMTVNANTALGAIKSDVASAGLGFFGNSNFQCYTLNLSVGATVKLNNGSFSPVRVTAGASNDQLDVAFASSIDAGANVLLKGSSTGTNAKVLSLLPVAVGQTVLLVPKTPGGKPCVVRSVTAVTAATEDTAQSLTFGNSGTHNGAAFATTPTFQEDPDKDQLAVLGSLQWSRFSVNGTDLQLERPLDTTMTTPAVLVRNVMAFRVQYGISASSTSTTLTGWQDAAVDAGGKDWSSLSNGDVDRVRALRIGLVTRSPQREKENKQTGACEASAAKPTLFGVTVTPDVTDWKCYRYRTAIVIVPLRNLAW